MESTSIKITRKQAEPILKVSFPQYRGKKITLVFSEKITFTETNWGGGTKNTYVVVYQDGSARKFSSPVPWNNPMEGGSAPIEPQFLIVEHSYFCGQDVGIHIYANPCYQQKLLSDGGFK